jgi:hypothetical protein
MIRASYYDDTSNPGGVYIMALCQYTPDDPNTTEVDESTYPVDASDCKYDAFKAPLAGCVEDCGPDQFGLVSGGKYYDTNRNGRWDEGEEGIDGWPIDFVDEIDGTVWTADGGLFSESFSADAYVFTERQPDSPSSWEQTGPSALESDPLVTGTGASAARNGFSYNVTVADNSTISGLYFGNVCEVTNTGGLTLGFWSNQNGRAILEAHDPAWRTLLNNLNLYRPTAGGSDFVIPTTGAFATFGTGKNKNVLTGGAYKVFRDWLLGADASVTSNMAYMLSAQMAATVLDYTYASLDEDSLVQDPGGNWVTISQLEAAANTLLGNLLDSVTTNNPTRSQLEAYKNIFDDLNNNRATVTPPDQDACTDPVFTALD